MNNLIFPEASGRGYNILSRWLVIHQINHFESFVETIYIVAKDFNPWNIIDRRTKVS